MNAHTSPDRLHSVYAPSSAHRWTVCTASAEAISRLPEQEEGEAAAKGTAAHEELERVLGGGDADPEHPAAHAVALAIAYVKKLPPGQMWVEQRVHLTNQIWGRCDIAHWEEATKTLTIVDLKNGQRAVDVEENEQLRIYAAGSILTHTLMTAKWVRYCIVQPNDWRPFVPRVKQSIESVADLEAWSARIETIPTSPKTFTAGEQCRDCPLFGKCEASLDVLANVGALVSGLVQPATVRSDQVAHLLAMRKPIEDAYKGFSKYWETQTLKSGVAPQGMKIVATTPHRAWKDEMTARTLILDKIGPNGLDVPTPAQAIVRGLSESTVHEMAPRPDGGPALAFENDKRKPWVHRDSATMFAGIPGLK